MEPFSEPRRPLRCLHYLPAVDEELGGVVRAVLDVVSALAEGGHEITLLTHDAKDCPESWSDATQGSTESASLPQVVPLGPLSGPLQRASASDLQIISEHVRASDVVHLHTPWTPSNLQLGKMATQLNKPYVLTLHGMLDDWCFARRKWKKAMYLRMGGTRLLEQAAVIHCTAQEEQRQSQKHAPAARWGVVPCLVDTSQYQSLPGEADARANFPQLSEPGYNLLFLSRIDVKKGVERLIDAAASLTADFPDLKVWIAGPGEPGYLEQLKQRAHRLGISGNIHFVGMVRDQLKLSLYQAADVFVLPTSQENFGLVSVEAMLCNTPVMTTFGVDIWKELEGGGAVITEINAGSVADSLRTLLKNASDETIDNNQQSSLLSRGQRGRQHVLEWLDPRSVVNQMLELYEQAIRFKSSGAS
ncbi:glycosyltransferase [Adhaeretor mobilis]|uniref:GDP-mannose-dependent alpha-(1-2)-phosphatidylinositol mannosyltransferase n=1 Tax=Adhaeretor mobilis TaxID=1930276 RepID=A0A517MRM3_9BACT|nr:glycosyltransferase [Adhaeretor mobilis]QDS97524.1 GDP-mannose-dependent alpha-(1-2)-phosphatidylinositol mannosyltransferase [Adhaeretor mobilis]